MCCCKGTTRNHFYWKYQRIITNDLCSCSGWNQSHIFEPTLCQHLLQWHETLCTDTIWRLGALKQCMICQSPKHTLKERYCTKAKSSTGWTHGIWKRLKSRNIIVMENGKLKNIKKINPGVVYESQKCYILTTTMMSISHSSPCYIQGVPLHYFLSWLWMLTLDTDHEDLSPRYSPAACRCFFESFTSQKCVFSDLPELHQQLGLTAVFPLL